MAQPEAASEEILLELLGRNDTTQILREIIGQIARDRGSSTTGFEPDTHWLQHRIPRAEGMAIASYSPEEAPRREQSLLELVIREDGGIRLICGRGTDAFPAGRIPASGQTADGYNHRARVGPDTLRGVARGSPRRRIRRLSGQWRLGIRMDRLRGPVPLDLLQGSNPLHRPGKPYSRAEYEKVASALTDELINAPHAVAELSGARQPARPRRARWATVMTDTKPSRDTRSGHQTLCGSSPGCATIALARCPLILGSESVSDSHRTSSEGIFRVDTP
jgi:hypothetical protein